MKEAVLLAVAVFAVFLAVPDARAAASVLEPASWVLFVLGVGALGWMTRRRSAGRRRATAREAQVGALVRATLALLMAAMALPAGASLTARAVSYGTTTSDGPPVSVTETAGIVVAQSSTGESYYSGPASSFKKVVLGTVHGSASASVDYGVSRIALKTGVLSHGASAPDAGDYRFGYVSGLAESAWSDRWNLGGGAPGDLVSIAISGRTTYQFSLVGIPGIADPRAFNVNQVFSVSTRPEAAVVSLDTADFLGSAGAGFLDWSLTVVGTVGVPIDIYSTFWAASDCCYDVSIGTMDYNVTRSFDSMNTSRVHRIELPSGYTLTADSGEVVAHAGALAYRVAVVPEPATWALFFLGIAGLGWMTRRRTVPIRPRTLCHGREGQLLAGGLLLAAQTVAFAQANWAVQVLGSATDPLVGQDPLYCSEYTGTGIKSVSCGARAGSAIGSGAAVIRSDPGQLGLATSASVSSSSDSSGAHARAGGYVQFDDMLRISSPGQTGVGTLTFSIYLARNLSMSTSIGPNANSAHSAAYVDATVFINESHRILQSDGRSIRNTIAGVEEDITSTGYVDNQAVGNALGYHTFSVPFVFDQYFPMRLSLTGDAFAQVTGSGSAATDLNVMHSLDWDGIKMVSVDGTQTDYTLWSRSGVDWNQSFVVPEPSTWLLMAVGLVSLSAVARRRSLKP